MIQDIIRLSNLCAVSGDEGDLIEDIMVNFKESDYQIDIDPIGNVSLHKDIDPHKKNVMVFAHMDEIGFMIRKLENNGYLRFERMGGVNRQIIPGCKVVLKTDKGLVPGVVGLKSHHFMPDSEKFTVPSLDKMYIDVFVRSKEEAYQLGIDVGTMVSFKPDVEVIRDTYITGKSLDNRVAVALLYELARSLEKLDLNYNLYIVFPVMEEFNIRGLIPCIRKIKPEYSIGLDITPACDTPDLDYNDIGLGKGPAITLMNFHGGGTLAGVLPHRGLFKEISKSAHDAGVHLQREVSPGVITENAFALFENEGVKVANLSIPTRYTHTPIETVQISDLEALLSVLLQLFCDRLNCDLKGKED